MGRARCVGLGPKEGVGSSATLSDTRFGFIRSRPKGYFKVTYSGPKKIRNLPACLEVTDITFPACSQRFIPLAQSTRPRSRLVSAEQTILSDQLGPPGRSINILASWLRLSHLFSFPVEFVVSLGHFTASTLILMLVILSNLHVLCSLRRKLKGWEAERGSVKFVSNSEWSSLR
jgi:hypothetical protein